MNWFYVAEGKQTGPVGDADLEQLVQQGKITADTLVWHEGMANWQPYSTVVGGPPPAAAAKCSQCGKEFPESEMIRHGNAFICAACKPVFLQKLKEGVGTGGPIDPGALAQDILAADYRVDIGGCISRAWELLKSNFWPIVGITLLVYLVIGASGALPYLGSVLGLILNGPLMGGLYWFYLKSVRGEEAGVGDAFGGFGPNFVKLMLANIVSSVLLGLCIVPALVFLVVGMAAAHGSAGGPGSGLEHLGVWLIPFIILLVIGFVAIMYLSICWIFMFPLIMDKGLNFWPAMNLSRKVVQRHWWSFFGLMIVGGLVAMLGVLLCCVGIVATIPILLGALMYAYEDIFGTTTRATA